jgi:PAS domain S-box-containing protein
MKKIKRFLILDSFGERLSENDLVSKQRFRLFKIINLFSLITYITFIYQVSIVLPWNSLVFIFISILFVGLFVNYFGLLFHKKQKISYISLIMILFTLLHIITYYEGGVRNSGMFYLAAIILTAYMLLGNKGGKAMALISVLHVVYFYFVGRNTTWVSYLLIGDEPGLIDLDFLITGTISILVLTAQSNYIEKSKNAIIEDILSKKDELGVKNKELKKLSLVASKTNNGVIITSSNGKVEWINDGFTRLTGFSADDVSGKELADMLLDEESGHLIENMNQKLAEKESVNEEFLIHKKDKSKTWVHENITPIADEYGNVVKFIGIMSDISERKLAEEKMAEYMRNLERTNKELDKFAYIVSHDLKAPLRAIGNLTGWIEEDVGDQMPPAVMKNFNIIKGRVMRMELLINGILDYSKAGKNKGQYVSFDTKSLVKETFDLIGAPDNCKLNFNQSMPLLHSDKIKLQQVFMNLINNAIKYCDKDEIHIKINSEEEKNFWHFSVEDNGPGIEKQYHDKIFVIFQTLNARDEVESTGVGLAIVKKIIEDQGGAIWVESEPGKGATFHFTWAKSAEKNSEDISKAEFVPV